MSRKLEWLSGEDLLKRVLSLEFNRLLDYYKDAPNIDVVEERKEKKTKEAENKPRTNKEKDRRTAEKGMARIYINVGKADGFYAGNLIELLNYNVQEHELRLAELICCLIIRFLMLEKGILHELLALLKGLILWENDYTLRSLLLIRIMLE